MGKIKNYGIVLKELKKLGGIIMNMYFGRVNQSIKEVNVS